MIISNSLRKEQQQETQKYTPLVDLDLKTELILEKALLPKETTLSDSIKHVTILSQISKALKIFLQEFAVRFKKEPTSLFTLSTQTFREFDHEKGHVVEYRFMSVNKTG